MVGMPTGWLKSEPRWAWLQNLSLCSCSLLLLCAVTVTQGSRDPAAPCFHLYLPLHRVVWTPILCNDRIWGPSPSQGSSFSHILGAKGCLFLIHSWASSQFCLCPQFTMWEAFPWDTSFSLHFPKEILILCVQKCCYRGGVVAEVDAVWAYSCFCSGRMNSNFRHVKKKKKKVCLWINET